MAMNFNRLEMTTCSSFLIIIVLLINSSLARDAKLGAKIWGLLKPEKDSVWGVSPEKFFPQPEDNLPNPDPNQLGFDYRKMKKLVGNYDPRYMSVQKPRVNVTKMDAVSRKKLMASMPLELKSLQFAVPGSERGLGSRASKKLRLWLWSMSSCAVLPLWKDFGATHWPRYINVGQCSQKKACSYPKGMKCKPSKLKRIRTLWWYCNERFLTKAKGTPCIWVKFQSAVVEKCKCSC